MSVDVEAIWSALTDRLRDGTSSFKTVTRRRSQQVGVEQLPALYVLDDSGDETVLTGPDAPEPYWRLSGEIVIVCRQPDVEPAPTTILNGLVKEVRDALESGPSDGQGTGYTSVRGYVMHYVTLGGLIRAMSISKVEKGAGELTGTAVARLSIDMEAR